MMKIFSVNPFKSQKHVYNKTTNNSFVINNNNVDAFEQKDKVSTNNRINFKSRPVKRE